MDSHVVNEIPSLVTLLDQDNNRKELDLEFKAVYSLARVRRPKRNPYLENPDREIPSYFEIIYLFLLLSIYQL